MVGDPTPTTGVNERRVEHYRRVHYARLNFAEGISQWDGRGWDRRGDVYIRFGHPDHRSWSDYLVFETDKKVTKVKKTGATSSGRVDFEVTAEVTKVDRSKSGRKVGDTIKFESYHNLVPVIGPLSPPKLKAGWTGTVYLSAAEGDSPYKLAVYGHSFVAKDE